ncbi:MAG: DUF2141 domain-containing protein [Bacteroidetes bacterium]|nr:DUF2141 domain-containing protein [Bacteroidota bacterium]
MSYVLAFLSVFLSPSNKYSLTVEVKNVPNNKGTVYVGLFRPQDEWPTYGKQFKGKVVSAVKGKTMVTFTGLSSGKYALAVYHDENKNNKLDKNLVGMPTEIYGFSNNARATFSAPEFSDAQITLTKSMTHSILLK